MSNPQPTGRRQPWMATNAAQQEIVNLLKGFFCSSVFINVCVFNVGPKTTLFLPVWPRDAKRHLPVSRSTSKQAVRMVTGQEAQKSVVSV